MVNSGCFQSQTDFMRSVGVVPTPGIPVIVNPEAGTLNTFALNLNN
jgi:DNA polymerase II small subunit/DNA polymerase delta subunit B